MFHQEHSGSFRDGQPPELLVVSLLEHHHYLLYHHDHHHIHSLRSMFTGFPWIWWLPKLVIGRCLVLLRSSFLPFKGALQAIPQHAPQVEAANFVLRVLHYTLYAHDPGTSDYVPYV